MKAKRSILVLLCLSMVLTAFAACSDKSDNTPGSDTPVLDTPKDGVPDDYTLDGDTIGILYAGHVEDEIIGMEDSQDIVFSKVYERNKKVEGRLNCKLDFISSGTTDWTDFPEVLTTNVNKLDDSFSIVETTNNTVIQMYLVSLFHDLNDTPFIDIDSEWWYKDAILECSIDGYYYRFLFGDINISGMGQNSAIFYNKRIYGEYVEPGNPDALYDEVLNGTWTFERFDIAVRNSYIDNGGENDIYGYTMTRYAMPLNSFPISCGIEFYKRGANGYPTVTVNNDKSIEFTNDLYNLLYNNPGAHLYFPNMVDQEIGKPLFYDGKYVFDLTTLSTMLDPRYRDMTDDYGVLPYPKWDKEQEEYITMNANQSTLVGCCKNVSLDHVNEVATAVLEAMASEGHRSIIPAFYENALQNAYSRDDMTTKMIDIICARDPDIKSRVTKNMLYEYTIPLGGIGSVFHTIMSEGKKGTPDFTSTYESINYEGLIGKLWAEWLNSSAGD